MRIIFLSIIGMLILQNASGYSQDDWKKTIDISTSILSYGEFNNIDDLVGSDYNKINAYNVFSYLGIGKKRKNDYLLLKLGYQAKKLKYESWPVVPNPVITEHEKRIHYLMTKLSYEKCVLTYKNSAYTILFNSGFGIDLSSAKDKKRNYYFISFESLFNYKQIGLFIELPLSLWRAKQRPTGSFFSFDIGIRYSMN